MVTIAKAYIPSHDKFIGIKQFTNREYRDLLKILIGKDPGITNLYLNQFIQYHIDQQISMNFIDKICVLLTLRCVSIGDTITHQLTHEGSSHNFRYNIYDVIQKLADLPKFDQEIHSDQITITLGAPNNIFHNINEIAEYVKSISVLGEIYDMTECSLEQRVQTLTSLPGEQRRTMVSRCRIIGDSIYTTPLFTIYTDVERKSSLHVHLQQDTDGVFNFLGIFFQDNIKNLMSKQFLLGKDYHMSYEYFDSISPIDGDMYMQFHKDIQSEREAQSKTNDGPTIPGMSPSVDLP